MTYISLVPVHELRGKYRGADSPDLRHREVMRLFGNVETSTPRSEMGILFRLDVVPGQAPAYLIRSQVPIENPTPGTRTKIEPKTKPPTETVVQFRVAVNGIQRVNRSHARPTRLDGQPPSGDDDPSITISEWLTRHLQGGMKEVSINNHIREILGADRRGRKTTGGKVVQIDTIDGVAIIDDPTVLSEIMTKGVGRAKSYGCGLLTVREIGCSHTL